MRERNGTVPTEQALSLVLPKVRACIRFYAKTLATRESRDPSRGCKKKRLFMQGFPVEGNGSCNVSNEWLTGRSRLDKCFDLALKVVVVVVVVSGVEGQTRRWGSAVNKE